MNKLPLVSVVIPCYNHESFIKEAIQSVINQDYENIELIIIDDGSKDNSIEVIKEMAPACIARFNNFTFKCRENKGLSATLNEMVDLANGKYFSGCASDDILLPNKISLLVNNLESLGPSYAVAFGDANFINDNKERLYLGEKGRMCKKESRTNSFLMHYTAKRGLNYKNKNEFGTYESLLAGNYLPAMSNLIRLDKIKEAGGWSVGNTIEDWELWLKLSKQYKFSYINTPVALYRLHGSNTIKTMKFELLRDSILLLEKEKEFALSKGHKSVFFKHLLKLIRKLRRHSKSLYIKKTFEHHPIFSLIHGLNKNV